MKKSKKAFIIILSASAVLTGTAVFFICRDTEYVPLKALWGTLIAMWVFFVVPAYVYAVVSVKKHLEKKSMEESVRSGLLFGYFLGILGVFLPALLSPYFGFMWYKNYFFENGTN